MDSTSNNKRIAKNTLLLYIRMFFIMGVSLYTSRVILDVLGVVDYGIYNVVGGVVVMFDFINSSMISATQRYLTFALGQNDDSRLKSVFNTSLFIHCLIALLIIILAETVGLWFLREKLIIPSNRIDAAFWVYQISIAVSVIQIVSVPYNADIIAREKMSAFAYISVLEVVLKLLSVFLLVYSLFDKLISYAILLFFVQLLVISIYAIYCRKNFLESRISWTYNKSLFKEMISFAGWSFFGNIASVLYGQGLNMLINMFFGPAANAARGVSVQVQSAVTKFITNFQMALNPQITKTYAQGELDSMHLLMFRSARFSFFLLYLLTLPIILETGYILDIWLKIVPENTDIFIRIMLMTSLIYTTANPCVIANQATGRVKQYQTVVGGLLLLILPISYIVLKLGAPVYSVFIVHFMIECIAQLSRMLMLRKLINIKLKDYIINIYIPIVVVVLSSFILPFYLHIKFDEGLIRFLLVGFSSVLSVGTCTYFFGLQVRERTVIKQVISSKIVKW